MSASSTLHIKPEEIDNPEKRGKYTVSIIGCGPIGVIHACAFAEAGFKVICADTDQNIISLLTKGKAPFSKHEIETKLKEYVKKRQINATSDIKIAVSQSNAILITMPIGIDEKKKTDYSSMEKTCKLVGSSLQSGSVVVLISIVGVGVMENTVKQVLENTSGFKVGTDFGLAYSPVRITQGQTLEAITDYERIIAALDKTSLNAASSLLETISKKGVRKTNIMKMAEAAVLFEIVQQDVNTALTNEFSLLCEKIGLDYFVIQEFAKMNTSNMISSATLPIGIIQEEPYLLLEDAENLNSKLRTASIAREVNEELAKHAVNLARDALRSCGKTLTRARISLLGISQIPNERSPQKIMSKELVKLLNSKGAKVSLYDPYFSDNVFVEMQHQIKKTLTETVEGADCIMIVTGHDQFKRLGLRRLKALMKTPAAIIDLEGAFEPDKVEKEGLIYRGLGRGVWTR
jgi:nucleotide sugar dehydrogenase